MSHLRVPFGVVVVSPVTVNVTSKMHRVIGAEILEFLKTLTLSPIIMEVENTYV